MRFLIKPTASRSPLALPALPSGANEVMVPYNLFRGRYKYRSRLSKSESRKQILITSGTGIAVFAAIYWLFSLHLGLLHMFPWWGFNAVQYTVLLIILFPMLTAPTHIQLGAQGIRFHWLNRFGMITGAWIGWDCITQIRAKSLARGIYTKNAIDLAINLNRVPPQNRAKMRLHACSSLIQNCSSDQVTVRLDANAITHDADRQKFLQTLQHFAGADQLDASVAQVCGDKNSLSYTKLWLDKLEDTGSAKRDLNPLVAGDCLYNNQFRIVERIAAGGQAITYLAERVETAKTIAERFLVADAIRAQEEQSIFEQPAQTENATGESYGGALTVTTPSGKEARPDKSDLVVLKEFVLPIRGGIEIRRKALENVQHEVMLLEKLNHPQIVKLIDFFVDSQRAYIAMEYVDGQSLRRLVADDGPFSEAQVTDFALQMCTLLSYLHSQEPPVLHRDFTPDNLLLRQDGKLCLIDFNVAEQLVSDCTRTVVGKHCYVSPEQFRGLATQQSDLYSLGATLFWLATGEDPEPISTSHPQSVNEKLSTEFDAIVAKTTAPDCRNRYGNAAELERDLQALPAVLIA